MLRSITNFSLLPAGQKPQLLARFVLILLVGSFDVICALILIQSQSMMAFRVGGALESLQTQYFMLNLCFSMLTFDLQAQLCLCILLISLHEVTLLHNIISATGVVWGCLKVTVGIIAILKELKPLVWIFLVQNVPEVVYLIYLLYTCFPPMEGSTPEPSPSSSHRVKPPQSSCPRTCTQGGHQGSLSQHGGGSGRCHTSLGAVQVGQSLKSKTCLGNSQLIC
uniref:DUF7789 domain-containing protein n=1 Tax=Serinus canaria TaxID=9135 RepID=A0A8C9NYF3_SERCA